MRSSISSAGTMRPIRSLSYVKPNATDMRCEISSPSRSPRTASSGGKGMCLAGIHSVPVLNTIPEISSLIARDGGGLRSLFALICSKVLGLLSQFVVLSPAVSEPHLTLLLHRAFEYHEHHGVLRLVLLPPCARRCIRVTPAAPTAPRSHRTRDLRPAPGPQRRVELAPARAEFAQAA